MGAPAQKTYDSINVNYFYSTLDTTIAVYQFYILVILAAPSGQEIYANVGGNELFTLDV